MKRVFTGTCLAAFCAAALSAQAPASQAPSSQAQDSMKTVTATGCLRAGETPNSFVLSDVKWAGKAGTPTTATGTAGTAGTAGSAAAATTLRLVGAPAGVQLTEHIGHTIEVSGNLNDKEKSAAGAAASGTGGDQTSRAKPDAKPEQTLNVRTVKMVSSSCDGK
jgi:hypothetical protein